MLIACSASALSLQVRNVDSDSDPPEGQETVSPALARVHVPHDPSLAHGAESAKRLGQHLVVHLRRQITHEHVVVVLRVLPVLLALVRPVDAHLGVKDLAPVQRLHRLLRRPHVGVLDKAVVEPAVLEISVLDDFRRDDGSGHGKDLGEHDVGDPRREVANVQVWLLGRLGHGGHGRRLRWRRGREAGLV